VSRGSSMVERRFHTAVAGGSSPPFGTFAPVAQLVEHLPEAQGCGGSIPSWGTR
jgi:hypothetical protein